MAKKYWKSQGILSVWKSGNPETDTAENITVPQLRWRALVSNKGEAEWLKSQ